MKNRLCLPLFFLLSCTALFAQQATITGTVTDQSGAVVANVPISVLHVETGTVVSGASSATGNFTISQLAIGKHTLTVSAPGFKAYKRENIQLSAAQVLRIEIPLEVGAQSDSITVTATSSMLKTDTSAVIHNITLDEMRDLPLMPVNGGAGQTSSNGFRDPFAVANMMPGVRYVASTFMLVNGLPQGSVQYRIEGQVLGNARSGFESLTHSTQPSVDAIEEVAIQTSNYSAEFGSVGGAVFNVTMKSGTNQYHGSAYDYAVNEILNASDPSIHTKNVERRHDFGGTFGGPVVLPKLYDGKNKTFFFFSLELFRLTQITNTSPTVPIQAYRDGDFSSLPGAINNTLLTVGSGAACVPPATTGCTRTFKDPFGKNILAGTLFDPASRRQVTCSTAITPDCGTNGGTIYYRDPLLNNKLRAADMDPVSLAIQNKYIPLPVGNNFTNGVRINNYQTRPRTSRQSNLPSIKIDHNITAAARLSFFWQTTRSSATSGGQGGNDGLPDTLTTNRGTDTKAPQTRINYDHTLTPTIQLHLGAGYSMYELNDAQVVTNFKASKEIGLNGLRLERNFPVFASTSLANPALGGMNAMGTATQGVSLERRPSGNVTLTWIKGSHTVKGGGEWRMDQLPSADVGGANGNNGFGISAANSITWQPATSAVTLSGQTLTGFQYANFLLGSIRTFSLDTPVVLRTSKQQWGAYLQDTWRARRNLTVDLGLRWDLGTYTKEDRGRNGGLSLTEPNPSASGRPGGLIYEATCKCNLAQNYPLGIGPRLGFSYTFNPKTVIRGGFGVAYSSTGTFGGFTRNSASAPTPEAGLDIFKLRDGYPASVNPQWPVFDANLGQAVGSVVAAPTLLDPNAGRPSRTYQWNVSIQREITRNLTIEASYVANRGIWQGAGGMVDFNAVGVDTLTHYGFTIGNAADNTMLNKALSALTPAEKATLATRGVVLPYPNFPTNQTVLQSIRNYPQYTGAISPSSAPLGRSWYDSLQLQINKRYSHGLLVNANYTYAKNLSARSLADVFNPDYDNKDLDGFNVPHQIRLSFEYQVPRPPAHLPILGNRFVSQAIGGWGVAMYMRYQTAAYIGRPASGATTPISRWLGRGPGGAQLKKDANGDYMNPYSVDWTDYSGVHHTDPINLNCHCFDPEKTLVLNPAAWEAVPDAMWAAQAATIPSFRGTRLPNESANLSRNFKFGKDGRYALQVRVEFQNAFNRLALPATPQIAGLNFNANPTKSTDGRYTAGFGTFGNLRNNNAFGAERSGVFIGRLTF